MSGYYDDDYHYIWLEFTIDIVTDSFTNSSCSNFVEATTLAKLGTNPLCLWNKLTTATDQGTVVTLRVNPGTDATIVEEGFELTGS